MNQLNIIDMFCGGGGESTGLISAAHEYDFDVNISAINHWKRAIETHAANYPFAEHLTENVEKINPEELKAGVNTDLLWASPGCQHFSVARGGKPKNEQLRAPAWEVLRFIETIHPKRVIIENVPEFQSWGPLTPDGKVIQAEKGKTFKVFIRALQSLNYIVSYRVLCAADYGAPTSRRRLFIQAVRKDCGKKIIWPKQTHIKDGDMFLPKWRAASEIIDWSIPCQLIKDRKKPLANATLKRIEYGIREFWGDYAEPFIAKLYGNSNAESINNPLSTISCSGAHHMLIQPSVTAIGQTSAKNRSRTLDKPLSTICTKQEHCLVQPFITEYYGNGGVHPIGIPLPTITTKDRFAVCGTTDGIELGFRMLQPKELAAATGFPADYKFTGTKVEVVKQIGNAVPPNFAKALFSQILKGL
ncbi:MAG: DNA cytosine methyltransferase [Treponema sp.]|nr:DNA cytosine methyltransferase [Treponema sp.]